MLCILGHRAKTAAKIDVFGVVAAAHWESSIAWDWVPIGLWPSSSAEYWARSLLATSRASGALSLQKILIVISSKAFGSSVGSKDRVSMRLARSAGLCCAPFLKKYTCGGGTCMGEGHG